MHNQGMGGLLGQLANSGLGGMLGQGAGQTAGGGGFLGSILGGIFGGGQPATPQPGTGTSTAPGAGGGLPPMMQAGMDAFGKMFQSGVPGNAGQSGNLGDEISSILSGKRN